jgi:hypothetical protein
MLKLNSQMVNITMKEEELISHIKAGLSIQKIAQITNKSATSIRYWLNKYNLKTDVTGGRACVYCGTKLVGRQKKYCCVNCKTLDFGESTVYEYQKRRGREKRIKLILEHGGSCLICGYNKNYSALQFHHLNPHEKRFVLCQRNCAAFNYEKLLNEASKCILVCGNCHAEIHNPEGENFEIVDIS